MRTVIAAPCCNVLVFLILFRVILLFICLLPLFPFALFCFDGLSIFFVPISYWDWMALTPLVLSSTFSPLVALQPRCVR